MPPRPPPTHALPLRLRMYLMCVWACEHVCVCIQVVTISANHMGNVKAGNGPTGSGWGGGGRWCVRAAWREPFVWRVCAQSTCSPSQWAWPAGVSESLSSTHTRPQSALRRLSQTCGQTSSIHGDVKRHTGKKKKRRRVAWAEGKKLWKLS